MKAILRNEVYLGHMAQNKPGNVSHKQIAKPESEWIRVENTHELIISQEAWELVRELDARKHQIPERQGRGNRPVHRRPLLHGLQITDAALPGQPKTQVWKSRLLPWLCL